MEEVQNAVVALTGAVNAAIEQLKAIDRRVTLIESSRVASTQDQQISDEISVPLCAPRNELELKEISKLPDCVKELQVFEGSPTQYVSWVHSVERILKDFEIVRSKPMYRAILQHIRHKIRGCADLALVSYNIFEDEWPEIKRVLSLHYADKRDIKTLEHQLNQLSQRGSLDEFYATINHQFSLIVNKIKTENYSDETVKVLVETYRNRALDVFVRGLNADLSRMIIVQKPQTLPEAYSACLELQNLTLRNNIIHPRSPNSIIIPNNSMNSQVERLTPPAVPQRPSHFQKNRPFQRPFNNHQGPSQNSTPPPRPLGPKPAERMDVDRSIQSRQVNYMNRPQNSGSSFKRRANFVGNASKQQRNFNIATEAARNESDDNEEYDQVNFMTDASLAYHT